MTKIETRTEIEEAADLLRTLGWAVHPPLTKRSLPERLDVEWRHSEDGRSLLWWENEFEEDTDDEDSLHTAAVVRPAAPCECCTCHKWLVWRPEWGAACFDHGIESTAHVARASAVQALLDYVHGKGEE